MSSARPRSATIRDVARLSGVSRATVTRVFQDSPLVRPETSRRVREAAERLGYRPNTIARALAQGTAHAIGVLVPSLLHPFWSEVADQLERHAADRGLSIVLSSSRGEPDREAATFEMLVDRRLDGIVVGGGVGSRGRWPGAHGQEPPVVLLEWDDRPQWQLLRQLVDAPLTRELWRLAEAAIPGPWAAHISSDDVEAGNVTARHLLSLGHTDVAYLTGPPVRSALQRLLGLRSALEQAGHRLQSVRVAEGTFAGGQLAARELLATRIRPTALVCWDDTLAVGAMHAARELGLGVPGDVSIVGHDDVDLSAYVDPPLTTFKRPTGEMCGLAVELMLAARVEDAEHVAATRQLPGELVVRASTGPPADVR